MAELALLVRNIVGDREQICVSQGNPHVLGLATGKTTRQMGVAKDASRPPAVHGLGHGVGVGHLALRRQLLLAVKALGEKARQHGKQEARMDGGGGGRGSHISAGNLERHDISLSNLDALGPGADLVDDAAELVSQDIALVHLHDGAFKASAPFHPVSRRGQASHTMEEMQVTPADCRASHLEDNVAVFDDFRLRDVNWERRPG